MWPCKSTVIHVCFYSWKFICLFKETNTHGIKMSRSPAEKATYSLMTLGRSKWIIYTNFWHSSVVVHMYLYIYLYVNLISHQTYIYLYILADVPVVCKLSTLTNEANSNHIIFCQTEFGYCVNEKLDFRFYDVSERYFQTPIIYALWHVAKMSASCVSHIYLWKIQREI